MKVGTQGSILRSIQTLFSVGSVGGMTDGELLEEFLSLNRHPAVLLWCLTSLVPEKGFRLSKFRLQLFSRLALLQTHGQILNNSSFS